MTSKNRWTPSAVRRLRAKLGLTQEALAARVGVSFSTVNRWERGRYTPQGLNAKALDALAKRSS